MTLFEIDPNTRMADLNKTWISTIKEFKILLKRDRGSEGDVDGRKKLQAIREFTFIYHFCDYKSKFANYDEDSKRKECLINADLPPDLDITKDKEFGDAIIKYKELQETPELKLLNELKEGIHTAHKVVRKIRVNLESTLGSISLDELEDEDNKKRIDPIQKLTSSLKSLMNIQETLPRTLKSINELENEVKKQLEDTSGLRGGKVKGTREDGTNNSKGALPGSMFD